MALYGGIEGGGTKFVCAVGTGPEDIRAEIRYPTADPQETLGRAIDFFLDHTRKEPLAGIGVACFGPIDPDPHSARFGYVTTTPKPGWAQTDVVGILRDALSLPVGFDTDVNVAALGEGRWGAAQGLDSYLYLTIGTGIGGGGMINGKLIHGLMHPEMGHMRVPHDWQADPYPGWCSYHGDCWEGLACGPAIEGRWGQRGETLPADHPAWDLEAQYLAYGLVNLILVAAPQRIIMGGGVMTQTGLFARIHTKVQELLNGYVQVPAVLEEIDRYIVPPALGNRAGVLGAIALAQDTVAAAPSPG